MSKRILVIDDDQGVLEAIASVLTYEEYCVKTALSPENIGSDIHEFNPDLILLDINLGNFNGLQICRRLKASSDTKHIPVVILSADDSIFDAIQLFGADDIVLKPLDLDVLLKTLAKYLLATVIPLNRNIIPK